MSTRTRIGVAVALSAASVLASARSRRAGHDHYVLTPNGKCHQVAKGQTAISDPEHGGHHRYHANVHVGATESATAPDNLGDGRAAVAVYKPVPHLPSATATERDTEQRSAEVTARRPPRERGAG